MRKLIRIFFEGMSSLTILAPDEPRGARKLNPRDYIHKSADDAIQADWQTVGVHLINAAKQSAANEQEKAIIKN